MKKIIMAAVLATSLIASENADYFGINFGNAELKESSAGASTKDDGGHVSATLGHYYGDTSRVSASYTYIRHDSSVDQSDAFSVAYDFILPLAENRFSLYAGPIVGYTRYKYSNLNLSGVHYGAQAGAIVRLIENIEFEAGYRYLEENGSDAGINLDDLKIWYVGANLRF